jgi:hypothetical protein
MNLLNSTEVCEILQTNPMQISRLVKSKKLIPFYDHRSLRLFELNEVNRYLSTLKTSKDVK